MSTKQLMVGFAGILVLIAGAHTGAASGAAEIGTTAAVPAAPRSTGASVTRSGPWAAIPACPVAVERTAGAVVDGRFFIIGGEEVYSLRHGYVQEYDPATGTWDNTNATMATPVSNNCAAAVGTDVYVPGGYDGVTTIATLQVYHTVTDAWETIVTDPLPIALHGPACAAYDGTAKVYVFGGSDTTSTYRDVTYIYDPTAAAGSRWTAGAAAPAVGAYGDAITAGGYLFYAGMRQIGILNLTDVYRYDPVADSWATMPSLTTPRGGARMWTYESKLAVGGGGWSSYLTSVEEYDLSTGTGGTWTAGSPLVTGSRTFAAAQDDTNGVLYAAGGWDGDYLADAEHASFAVPVELSSFTVE